MIGVDLSVLACAANRFAPEHARATEVLESLANGDRPWALPWSVVHEFIQLVTHPHAVARPLEGGEASAFVEQVLRSPTVRLISPTAAHAPTVAAVLETVDPEGGLPAGFETAVLLREHGVRELLSSDRGMRRFPFLTVIDPLHGEPWSADAAPTRRYRSLRAAR